MPTVCHHHPVCNLRQWQWQGQPETCHALRAKTEAPAQLTCSKQTLAFFLKKNVCFLSLSLAVSDSETTQFSASQCNAPLSISSLSIATCPCHAALERKGMVTQGPNVQIYNEPIMICGRNKTCFPTVSMIDKSLGFRTSNLDASIWSLSVNVNCFLTSCAVASSSYRCGRAPSLVQGSVPTEHSLLQVSLSSRMRARAWGHGRAWPSKSASGAKAELPN